MICDVDKEGSLHTGEPSKQDRNSDAVGVKYINLNSVKFVIFTQLESTTSQRQTCIVYKVDTGAKGNLILLNIFKNLFPKSTMEELYTTQILLLY